MNSGETPRNSQSSGKPSRIFWLTTISAILVGLLGRYWINNPYLEKVVSARFQDLLSPQDHWQAGRIGLRLAAGVWPEISLRFENFKYTRLVEACQTPLEVSAEEVALPLSWLELFQGRLTLAPVRLSRAEIRLPKCGTTRGQSASEEARKTSLPQVKGASDPVESVKPRENENISAKLAFFKDEISRLQRGGRVEGLSADHLVVVPPSGPPLTLRRLSLLGLGQTNGPVLVTGLFEFGSLNGWSGRLPTLYFAGKWLDQRLQLDVSGHWREGTLSLSGEVAGLKTLSVKTDFNHLPLWEVGEVVEKFSSSQHERAPRTAWISCAGHLSSNLAELRTAHLVFAPCQIEGVLGRATIPELQLGWENKIHFEKFEARMEHVSLDRLAEFARLNLGTRGVIASLGHLDGTLSVRRDHAELVGAISGAELLFSNFGRRALQKIENVRVQMALDGEELKANLSEWHLRGGEAQGQVNLRWQKSFNRGEFEAKISPLKFSREVEELLLSGQTEQATLEAKGYLGNSGRIDSWQARFTLPRLQGQELDLDEASIAATSASDRTIAKFELKRLRLRPSDKIQWLSEALSAQGADWLTANRVRGEFSVAQRKLSWQNLQMTWSQPQATLVSGGGWDENDSLGGWLQVSFASGSSRRWILAGERSEPELQTTQLPLSELTRRARLDTPSSELSSSLPAPAPQSQSPKGMQLKNGGVVNEKRGL